MYILAGVDMTKWQRNLVVIFFDFTIGYYQGMCYAKDLILPKLERVCF